MAKRQSRGSRQREVLRDPGPEPRAVPWTARATVVLGTQAQQIGWVLLGLGMVGVWAFTLHADYASVLFAVGEVKTATGQITSIEETAYSTGRAHRRGRSSSSLPRSSSHSRRAVMAYRVVFADDGGSERSAVSYGSAGVYDVGVRVGVEYPAVLPSAARIKGLRLAPVAWYFGLIPAGFAVVGFVLVVPSVRRGWREARLLRVGRLTRGELVSRKATAVTDNNRRVYRYVFSFVTEDGRSFEAVAKAGRTRRVLEDEGAERILYDPGDPRRALVLDTLADRLRVGEDGGLLRTPGRACASLLLPGLAVIGHGCWVLFAYVL